LLFFHVDFFVSPYVRTRETLNGIAIGYKGSPDKIVWKEDIRLREHEKGFGTCVVTDEEYAAKRVEAAKFGSFFYRWPGGESHADVWDRVYSFRESLRRVIRVNGIKDNIVVVTHGIWIVNFLMHSLNLGADDYLKIKPLPNCAICVLEPFEQPGANRLLSKFRFVKMVDLTVGKEYSELPRETDPQNWGKQRMIRTTPPPGLSKL